MKLSECHDTCQRYLRCAFLCQWFCRFETSSDSFCIFYHHCGKYNQDPSHRLSVCFALRSFLILKYQHCLDHVSDLRQRLLKLLELMVVFEIALKWLLFEGALKGLLLEGAWRNDFHRDGQKSDDEGAQQWLLLEGTLLLEKAR